MSVQQAFDLAVRQHQSGQLQQAESLYRQVLAKEPRHAQALHLLGVIAHQLGHNDIAVDLIRRAIAFSPNFPIAHNNLGNVLRAMGRLDEAVAAIRQAIVCEPTMTEAHYNLGNALKDQGQCDAAIAAYRQAIALKPSHAQAHNNLGNALRDAGRLDEAVAAYRQSIAIRPDYAEAHNNLGNVLRDGGRFDEAVAAYRQAIAHKPGYAQAHSNLGNALRDQGQFDEAIAAYRQAIALEPGYCEAHGNLGLALRRLGRFDEAASCLRHALTIRPDARFYAALVSTGRQAAGSAEVEALIEIANDPGSPVDDRIDAEFALGKWFDDAERFDDAFAHFAQANRLFRQSREEAGERFDGEELKCQIDRTIQSFTPGFFAGRRQWGDASELPVFIVGMPRSGTSLVEQIAASHPTVFGAGELSTIEQLSRAIYAGQDPAAGQGPDRVSPSLWDAQWIAKASNAYLEHLRSLASKALRVTDKLPGNVFHLGLIATLFPGARVIFCRRDARDNCLSCYFERFAGNNHLYSYDLADCGRQYRETERLTGHWLKTLPLRMLEIQYETLVGNQEEQSRRLIDFLELPWDPACLEFHRTKRPVMTASAWQVRQPIYTRSVGRWRHYERHLGPLLEALDGPGDVSLAFPRPSVVDGDGRSLPERRISQAQRS